MTITRKALAQAAANGQALDHLTAGYDDSGEAVYALADIAHALEVSEAELLQHAEQRSMTEQLRATPAPHRIH
ncbi:MAG: hypothetical protein Q8S08_10010 [Halomonas sp.]|nr:hypothetical protein [Halomonas sp.]MDP3535710.1 hypothetical protein [Halomonas sp.]